MGCRGYLSGIFANIAKLGIRSLLHLRTHSHWRSHRWVVEVISVEFLQRFWARLWASMTVNLLHMDDSTSGRELVGSDGDARGVLRFMPFSTSSVERHLHDLPKDHL